MVKRQGDVLFVKTNISAKEVDEVAADPRGLVVAEGESSGHCHVLFGNGCKLFRFRDTTERQLAVVGKSGAEVRVIGGGSPEFPRHLPVALSAGTYEIRVQRSWTSAHRARQVQD